MSLSVGIVGLPNVGKSTLFNALLKKTVALAANYPFATIEPNIGIVDVPDPRLIELSEFTKKTEKIESYYRILHATIKFVDIAGIVKGASQGEGLGNKFLAHIREVDAIIQVVRAFSDPDVIQTGSNDPQSNISTVNTELILADLETIQKLINNAQTDLKRRKDDPQIQLRLNTLQKIQAGLNQGQLAKHVSLTPDEHTASRNLPLITLKPMLYVFNVDEDRAGESLSQPDAIIISAKIEAELSNLDELEAQEYLQSLGLTESGLHRLARKTYDLIGLQSFFTTGPKETRAWTIPKGTKAPQAAAVIHTDFEKGFIKAEVINYQDLIQAGSYAAAKESGKLRLEGKDYLMRDGDVVEFKVNA
jgi:GTP-binding protein YchF